MSLGIVVAGPEGIVLAADSRVTLFGQQQMPNAPQPFLIPASFDNATKLLKVKGQDHVAAITYGTGAIGTQQPRTAHSLLPEFETELGDSKRLGVAEFAKRLSDFFARQWAAAKMPVQIDDMVFFVTGYDEKEAYGSVCEVHIPRAPEPVQKIPPGTFGAVWGGQRNITDRIFQGFDTMAIPAIYELLKVQEKDKPADFENQLKARLQLKIPVQFLPLQDSVDLAIFLIRATILLQRWVVDVRGVGGAVDVATITRTTGFSPVQLKQIIGEQAR